MSFNNVVRRSAVKWRNKANGSFNAAHMLTCKNLSKNGVKREGTVEVSWDKMMMAMSFLRSCCGG